ncbi:MAG: hypothetical protein R2861_14290 [Desulfobacterales bacterium]
MGGYPGGERNPLPIICRQSDAHVWVDVWQGDDAADAAGASIPRGGAGAKHSGLAGVFPGELPDFLSQGLLDSYGRFGFAWDAVSTQWSAWFEGYSIMSSSRS